MTECPICLEQDKHLFQCNQCKIKSICEDCYIHYYLKNDIKCPLCRYTNYDETFVIDKQIEYDATKNYISIGEFEDRPCLYSLISLSTFSIVMCIWSLA